ncbi:MAG: IscS subfamily cysteine desulfurase [Dehalococcoidia bacterium]
MSDLKANERRAICGICAAGCWVIVTYDDQGKIAKVRADETSEYGMICPVGEASPEIVYSRERLRYPLKRKGPKGTYEFEPVTWDEAYDTIVENLHRIKAESGPEATAIYTGSGSFELAFCDIFQPEGVAVSSAASVLFPFGSPNTLGVGALCYVSFAMIAPHVTMGGMFINMFSDIENANLIVIWGKNPAAHCPPSDFRRIEEAHRRGARIVVIDPRKTVMARYPNAEWIPIRPGSDGALALALCNVLIEEELYDEAFVRDWTVGFEEFDRYVQHFRPEIVEGITGVPAETIRSLARRIATTNGVAPVMYSGLEYSDGAVQAIRATMVLWALAGQLDVPGGRCFTMRENHFPINREGLIPNPDVRKAAGHNNFPIYTMYRGEFHANILPEAVLEGKPYPIRLMISVAANIIASWPQSDIWRKTLNGLDFLVCVDRHLTEDAAYADIVLPATTYYEIESYMRYGPMFRIRERVIEPVGEARNDFFILAELARRLGYGHLYPQTEEEVLSRALRGSGYSVEDVRAAGGTVQVQSAIMEYKKWEKGLLRGDGKPGFDTPSGKFEIASSILEEHGYDALPVYTEPGESSFSQPELAGRYPLVFNSGARSNVDIHTLHLSTPGLAEQQPVPTVMMNALDAEERGIENGDFVYIKTKRGQVGMYAYVTGDIVRGAIEATGMGGGPRGAKEWRNTCVNELTDLARFDPISGFPVYKALLCEVVKDSAEARAEVGSLREYSMDSTIEERGKSQIYMDYNATAPMAPEVKEAMVEFMEIYGNPSGIYGAGKRARVVIEDARRSVALLINSTARRIVFTGVGSEANNLAIKGMAFAGQDGRDHIVTSSIEHPSVRNTCRWLESQGFEVTYLPVDSEGRVSPDGLRDAITEKTLLVSIMLANNETGAIQPIRELSAIAREYNVPFHSDAVQAAGKIPLEVRDLGVDLMTISAHKFGGPKGVGALFVRKGLEVAPLINGGHQEYGLRAGTENVMGIAGMGRAAELAMDTLSNMKRVQQMRDRLEQGVREVIPSAILNGPSSEYRLPNTLNLTMPGIRGESLVLALDQYGVAISSGSACRSGAPDPSHALLSMGLLEEDAHCSVRFSLGLQNSVEEIETVVSLIDRIINHRRETVRFVSCR